MADVFGRNLINITAPITADNGIINWGGTILSSAVNVVIGVAQPITRRRTIGNQQAVIYAGQPAGTIQIARLITDLDGAAITTLPGWNVCSPTTITISFNSCDNGAGITYTASGCVVSGYNLSAEAEGLTVTDNVTIEFLQLSS